MQAIDDTGRLETELGDAAWIGGPGQAFCRHVFELPRSPVSALLKITADPHSYAGDHWQPRPAPFIHEHWTLGGSFLKYRLFLNGALAAVGPFRPIEDGVPVVHTHDVTAMLRPGSNTLAVLSRGERRGFALSLHVTCADGSMKRIVSGSHWKQREADSVYRAICWETPGISQFFKGDPGPGEYHEHLDGRRYPQGWRQAEFDDRNWAGAATLGAAVGVCERCAAPPYDPRSCSPVSIRRRGEGDFVIDFGHELFGGIELSAPPGGGAVELRLAEEMHPDGNVRYQMRTGNCYQEIWTFTGESEPLHHFGSRMFRYAQVVGWPGELSAGDIRAVSVLSPFDGTAASFRCSEDRLERVWVFCRDSVARTTADVYTDCLSRERLAYEADSYVTMLTQFCTEGSAATARRTLAYLCGHPSWPCEWWQTMIPLFHEYLLHTGDLDFVARHYAYLRDRTSFHDLIRHGLIHTFAREVVIDWPAQCRDGYVLGPANLVPNAHAYRDLVQLERLARWLGREREAARFQALAEELHEGINRSLFDQATGLYVDSLDARHSSLHANVYALCFGLVPESRVAACAAYVRDRGMACSIYTAQFVLEALFEHGHADAAVAMMMDEGERSWLGLIRGGATVTTECWPVDDKHNMSWAHPWGSSPGNVVVRHLMGLRPVEPGWGAYVFDPRPGGIDRARVSLVTPRGRITAGFTHEHGICRASVSADFQAVRRPARTEAAARRPVTLSR